MPLELNGERISAQKLAEKLGVSKEYSKIIKNPVFFTSESLEIDKLTKEGKNSGKYKKRLGKGYELLTRFTFWDEKLGIRSEVRYYTSKQHRTIGGVTKEIYIPSGISLGASFYSPGADIELSVFMYLAPACQTSPLHDESKHTPIYVFDDKIKAAEKEIEKYSQYNDVSRHLNNLLPESMPLIARGLGIPGVKDMTITELKAAIYGFAYDNKKVFLDKITAHETEFTGQIILAIENGVFTMVENGGVSTYSWGKGHKSGKYIFQSNKNDSDHERSFISHIKENFEIYYDELMRASKESISSKGVESFLAAKKDISNAELPKSLEESNDLSSVVDTASAKRYLAKRSPSNSEPSMTNGKRFFDDVTNGLIGEFNVDEHYVGYLTKSDKEALGINVNGDMPDIED